MNTGNMIPGVNDPLANMGTPSGANAPVAASTGSIQETAESLLERLKSIYDKTDAVNANILTELKTLTSSVTDVLKTVKEIPQKLSTAAAAAVSSAPASSAATTTATTTTSVPAVKSTTFNPFLFLQSLASSATTEDKGVVNNAPANDYGNAGAPANDYGNAGAPANNYGNAGAPENNYGNAGTYTNDYGNAGAPANEYGNAGAPANEYGNAGNGEGAYSNDEEEEELVENTMDGGSRRRRSTRRKRQQKKRRTQRNKH
jgi:hypothetical protein